MNPNVRKKTKNDVDKQLIKMMNNSIFWKTLENKRKYRDIKNNNNNNNKNKKKKQKKREKTRNLVSAPNYHSKKFFIETLLAIEMSYE